MPKFLKEKNLNKVNEEKEIKIKLTKRLFPRTIKIIESIAILTHKIEEKDEYFDTSDLRIINLNRGLRIRFQNKQPTKIEFKSLFYNHNARQDNPWFIEEIVFLLPLTIEGLSQLNNVLARLEIPRLSYLDTTDSFNYQYSDIKQLFSKIGLNPNIVVSKLRKRYQTQNIIFEIDYIKKLGYFLEIETTDGSDPIDILKNLFGIKKYQVIRCGYNDMIAYNMPNYLSNKEKQQKFKENPKWNVLAKEKEIVEAMLSRSK